MLWVWDCSLGSLSVTQENPLSSDVAMQMGSPPWWHTRSAIVSTAVGLDL